MYTKARLTLSDEFSLAYAIQRMSSALVSWLRREVGALAIANEHFAIEGWDDVVIWEHDGVREHVQLKNQTGPLDDDKLSEPLRQAAKFLSTPQATQRRFVFAVPSLVVPVGSSKPPRNLAGLDLLVTSCRSPHVTPDGLKSKGGHTTWLLWLEQSLGLSTAEVIALLQRLQVRPVGDIVQIRIETERELSRVFVDGGQARNHIGAYFKEKSDPAGQIEPRDVWRGAAGLKELLRPEVARWAYYAFKDGHSRIDGPTFSQANHASIEAVAAFWPSGDATRLVIQGMPSKGARDAFCRLALHTEKPATAQLDQLSSWTEQVRKKTGGTIGEDRLPVPPPNWQELLANGRGCDVEVHEVEQFVATSLDATMDDWMQTRVFNAISLWLSEEHPDECHSTVQQAMSDVWAAWKAGPLADATVASAYLRQTLAFRWEEEKAGVSPALRYGVRALRSLSEAVRFHLAIAAAWPDDADPLVTNPMACRLIALARVAPNAGPFPCSDLDLRLPQLLHFERLPILLPQVRNENSLQALHEDARRLFDLDKPLMPVRRVMSPPGLRKEMLKGLEPLRQYLSGLSAKQSAELEAVVN